MEEALAKLNQCAPESGPEEEPSFAIKTVMMEPDATKLQIVISATSKTVDFDFPVYRLSSGRWLINGKGRAYLIDEACREYKLKDRKSLEGYEIPLEGRIKLNPGQKFEALLVFPRVSDGARVGMLIYDGHKRALTFQHSNIHSDIHSNIWGR